ncbi:peptidase inhibitor family I36 protein [Kineococcus rhizosphaerae]|uniref:Stage II sporulation protein n=1 Tax=Kineococcus rhizosphaerae TaxID=559628 RepID=A0A2T0R3G9_9ACTN|nr:peptidase inhibitor family I36 protein [Kineococcus rhizosphaerae]PRY14561.1 stage II sporulation protein [Kineococcus rhizosphaerae]
MRTRTVRTLATLTGLVALTALTAVGTAAPAGAAVRDGTCESGEFCYYYNSNQSGAVSDFRDSLDDYGTSQPTCFEFRGTGAGRGLCVKNNAASVWNRTSKTVRVYYNSNFAGAHQDFAAGTRGNLNATLKNNDASHEFLTAPPVSGCATDGTDERPPTSILVYRVALNRVDRVPFQTYVKNVLPNEWIASWPNASLDAGAVAVKNYAWHKALHSTSRTPAGQCFDVRDTTADQRYVPSSARASTSAAVERTWNTRLLRSGRILLAHYCKSPTACSGWVQGDWMSQEGSRDQAAAGRSSATILRSWYRDVVVAP